MKEKRDNIERYEPACSIVTAPVRAVREPPLPTTLHSNLTNNETKN